MDATDYMKSIPYASKLKIANKTGVSLSSVSKESLEWLSESPEFKSLLWADNCTFLWLHAKPGEGKTIIATYIRQNLSKSQGYSQERDIAAIFCCNKDTEIAMVWSLALQLSCRIDQANARHIEVALSEFSKDQYEEAAMPCYIWTLLEELITILPRREVIFIIDAIDEIRPDVRTHFLKSLRYLEKKTQTKAILRIFISCRDYPDIREALGHYPTIEKGKEWKGRKSYISYESLLIILLRVSRYAPLRRMECQRMQDN